MYEVQENQLGVATAPVHWLHGEDSVTVKDRLYDLDQRNDLTKFR